MGAEETAGSEPDRLPEDIRKLAQRAATFEAARQELRDALIAGLQARSLPLDLRFRKTLGEALVAEGWEPDNAGDFAHSIMSEKEKWPTTSPIVFTGDARYAADRVEHGSIAWIERLRRSCDGAPFWYRIPVRFVVVPILFVVSVVVVSIVGVFDPKDWRHPG
jgi:hypothetical protein